jgi:hypothetical protein
VEQQEIFIDLSLTRGYGKTTSEYAVHDSVHTVQMTCSAVGAKPRRQSLTRDRGALTDAPGCEASRKKDRRQIKKYLYSAIFPRVRERVPASASGATAHLRSARDQEIRSPTHPKA